MPAFPTLASGVSVCMPWTMRREYPNVHSDMPHGWRYSYNERGTPLHSFEIEYTGLSDADLQTLKDFWIARGGAYEEFTFTDPDTTTVHTKCRFVGDELTAVRQNYNENSVRLVIQEYV